MRKTATLLLLLTFLNTQISFAQKQANRWYFGMFAGLDFNSGAPVPVLDGMLNTAEGSSSIADANGQLLFYTDGITVFNRIHDTMPNGIDLMGDISSTQSALIVQKPNSTNLYYVFTTDADGGTDGFRYSIVDLTLDGGNGDVSAKNIFIKNFPTEKISGVGNSNGTGVWVMTHDWGTNGFYAYFLSDTGLNMTPVVSNVGTVHSSSNFQNTFGQMKFSPNGQKLVLGIGYQGIAELFDFDNTTGVVTQPVTFNLGYSLRGVEFSPDNTKFYTTRYDNLNDVYYLDQFDLSAGNDSQIIASKFPLSNADVQAQLQLGPDGKIYMAKFNTPFLGVINAPNALGTACDFQDNSFLLDSTFGGLNLCGLGLPGFVQSYFKQPPVAGFGTDDTLICPGECVTFTNLSFNKTNQWFWSFPGGIPDTSSDENPTNICYPSPGFYTVSLITGNGVSFDTLTIGGYVKVRQLPSVSISVNGDTMHVYNGVSFQWFLNDNPIQGETDNDFIADSVGSYTVEITDSFGCVATSSPIIIAGVENLFSTQSLKIFPVPAIDYVRITLPDNIQSAVSIHNILGQEMKNATAETGSTHVRMDISSLPDGYYLVKCSAAGKVWTKGFVKR